MLGAQKKTLPHGDAEGLIHARGPACSNTARLDLARLKFLIRDPSNRTQDRRQNKSSTPPEIAETSYRLLDACTQGSNLRPTQWFRPPSCTSSKRFCAQRLNIGLDRIPVVGTEVRTILPLANIDMESFLVLELALRNILEVDEDRHQRKFRLWCIWTPQLE